MSKSFTAEQYRIAAQIIEEDGCPVDLVPYLRGKAEQLSKVEDYAQILGAIVLAFSGSHFNVAGVEILSKIIKDGWTPPEGLF